MRIWLLPSLIALLAAGAAERPNILLILTDDQGWPTLGCYGGSIVPTPNLDRLAANGARFTNAYVTSQCTPTRATLLTGQYTARHGLWHVLSWYGYPRARVTEPMFPENYSRNTFTIAKGLQKAGYRTAIVGKWHLTSNADGNYMGINPKAAQHYGFDYAPPILSRKYFEPGADRGVDRLTDQALEFIGRNKQRPWFCLLSHHMIHGVVVAPKKLEDKYRRLGYGDEGPNRAVYLAGLEHIDHSVGRIMDRLNELGMWKNTLVLFLSDNGGIWRRLGFKELPRPNPETPEFQPDLVEYNNAPLREGKGSIYEGGVRVPFIASLPGRFKSGITIDTPVHAIDILPTCFQLANVRSPKDHPLDGRSLVKLLSKGADPGLGDRPLFQYYPFYDLRWGLTPSASIRLGDYKLIEFFGDRVGPDMKYDPSSRLELYHLRTDIGESKNLATRLPRLAGTMKQRLRDWMQDIGAEVPVLNKHHDPAEAFVETRKKPEWLKDVKWTPN